MGAVPHAWAAAIRFCAIRTTNPFRSSGGGFGGGRGGSWANPHLNVSAFSRRKTTKNPTPPPIFGAEQCIFTNLTLAELRWRLLLPQKNGQRLRRAPAPSGLSLPARQLERWKLVSFPPRARGRPAPQQC